MMRLLLVAALAALYAATASNVFAQSNSQERMKFNGSCPNQVTARFVGTACTIYASGDIDVDAGKRFESFLVANHVPVWSYVYFNSPGGNPIGAMSLGRVLREHHLRTDIGRLGADGKLHAGYCFSACALAFLGGEFRYRQKGSRYGVHRFSFSVAGPTNTDVAQVLAAAEVEYIRSMGVDPTLWTLSASTSSRDIDEPTKDELLKLGVLNNGRSRVKWSIESIGSEGLYFKGEQNTENGIHKFIIGCPPNRELYLYIIFDPQGRQKEAVQFRADSLMVDGKPHPINRSLLRKEVKNGWLNAVYRLTPKMLALIESAHTVGVTTQLAYGAPVYLGFDAMPFEGGAAKLRGFLTTCGGH